MSGEPVFVPYTLPGETVDADRVPGHPDRRHLLRVIEPSPDRVEPFCPHFGICGGCATQQWALSALSRLETRARRIVARSRRYRDRDR